MPRPKQCRRVCHAPNCTYFKPAGIPTSQLEEIVVSIDELEAVRLLDAEGLYQEAAAEEMGVSRRTFGRIIEAGRQKVAQALTQGMALRIEGGEIAMNEQRAFVCADCGHQWQVPFGTGRPAECPECQSSNFHRAEQERGGRGRHRHRGRGRKEETHPDVKEPSPENAAEPSTVASENEEEVVAASSNPPASASAGSGGRRRRRRRQRKS